MLCKETSTTKLHTATKQILASGFCAYMDVFHGSFVSASLFPELPSATTAASSSLARES